MFTTGSKLLIGSAVAAWLFALAYGITQGGILGSLGLVSAALALSLLAGLNLFVRDSNISGMDHDGFDAAASAQATARPSLWPLLVAIGATTLTLGLVTYRAVFVLGLVAIIAGTLEWLIQGWSERASGEQAYNAAARNFLVDPLELPVAGAIGAGIVVFSFSRIMLGLPSKTATVAAFAVAAAVVLVVGTALGTRRGLSKATMTGAFSVAAIALIAGGAFAGLNGERETEKHHTTGDLAADDECTAEETEADENSSQTVAGKSNSAAEVFYEDDALSVQATGFDGNVQSLTIPRSNPSNVLFRNRSDEEARLVIELHPAVDDQGLPLGPERLCTALVEPGGVQLLTVVIDRPSFAVEAETGAGFAFTVAGTDAELEVVVP